MINSLGPILVPIGFAEQSIVALEQAVNIAKVQVEAFTNSC